MGGKVLEYEAKTIRNEEREKNIKIMVSALRKANIPIQNILEMLQEEYGLTVENAKKYVWRIDIHG